MAMLSLAFHKAWSCSSSSVHLLHCLTPRISGLFLRGFTVSPCLHRNLVGTASGIQLCDDQLCVSCEDVGPISLHYFWLRDHCRCAQCYNHVTKQRKFDLLSVPLDIHPSDCHIEGEQLIVKWPDDHVSKYELSWLSVKSHENFLKKNKAHYHKWLSPPSDVAHVSVDEYLNHDDGLKQLLKSLVKFGVGFVEGVDATVKATGEVVQRLGPVQRTLFGDVWEIKSSKPHLDTAFSTESLGAHTDNTYFTEASGLQVFHCLSHDGVGGENLLVDGFRAAEDVKRQYPESYHILTSTSIESEYLEPGQHHTHTAPVICLHPVTLQLQQIRYAQSPEWFNLYDRAPMKTVPHTSILSWYHAMRCMSQAVRNPDGEWWIKLKPGSVMFVDNWRVLHGRSAFSGTRWVAGGYVSRSDFLSCARVCGVLSCSA